MISNIKFFPENINNAYPVIKETIPMTRLGYSTNNKYDGFPPLMNDGRSITANAQTEALINSDLLKTHNITSNWQYRNFLTHNASKIMIYNFTESSNDIGYYKRYAIANQNMSNIPSFQPSFVNNIMDPVNQNRQSDLKETYLTREQLNARKVAPVFTTTNIPKI